MSPEGRQEKGVIRTNGTCTPLLPIDLSTHERGTMNESPKPQILVIDDEAQILEDVAAVLGTHKELRRQSAGNLPYFNKAP